LQSRHAQPPPSAPRAKAEEQRCYKEKKFYLVSIGFGALQKRLNFAEQYAEHARVKTRNRLIYQGFSVFGI